MGRMAEARKRARRAEPGAPAPERPAPSAAPSAGGEDFVFPAEEAAPPAAPAPAPAPAAPPEPEAWVAREESFAVPAPPAASAAKKLVLPASGLASDILALAESAGVEAAPGAALPAPVPEPEAPAEPARSHNISFFAAPARDDRKAVEATEHLATFFLSGEEYGVDVRMVQEIIRVADITQVPRAPDFIKGVINLRGRIIPVVDLKRKLGLGEVDVTRQARIVVVKLRDRLIGLLVDGASQVLKVPLTSIDAAPEEVSEIEAGSIRGVAKLKDRLIILMDLHKILTPELREGSTPA